MLLTVDARPRGPMPEDPQPANQPDWETSTYDPAQPGGAPAPDFGAAVGSGVAPPDAPSPGHGSTPGYPPAADYPYGAPSSPTQPAAAPGEHPYHLTPAFDLEPEPADDRAAYLTTNPQRFDLRFRVLADDAYDT